MVGIFSVALVGKSFAFRPGNDDVAVLLAVVAPRLPVQVVELPLCPPLLKFLAPKIFSAHARIAPGEIVVVEAVILIVRHPVSDIRVLKKLLRHAKALVKELSRVGGMDVLRSTNRDRL